MKYTYPKHKIAPTVEAGIAYTHLFRSRDEKQVGNLLRHNYFGYYLAAGADYKISTNNSVFIRFVYEMYPFYDSTQFFMQDKISLPHLKTGYTF
jgi:outer membrane protein W